MKSTKPLLNPTVRTLPTGVGIVQNGVTGQKMQPVTTGQGSSPPTKSNSNTK